MLYSKQQAEQALSDVERTERRAFVFQGYERGAPHFFLWGLIWFMGYGLSDLWPRRAGLIWLVLWLCGILGGALIRRSNHSAPKSTLDSWRITAAASAMFAFLLATYFVMTPHSGAQFGAFPALVVSFIYVLTGIWRGLRWVVAGLVVGALTLISLGVLHEYFMLWMAVVGGSALILTGLWLRRA